MIDYILTCLLTEDFVRNDTLLFVLFTFPPILPQTSLFMSEGETV